MAAAHRDPLDLWMAFPVADWPEYAEVIVHARTWLEGIVRNGSAKVAARAGSVLLAHKLVGSSRAVLKQRFPEGLKED